ncbi:MAG: MFS transporter [Alphaproteobacteria bacterium]|nr:MFS transporter [Alphaproteobacteria bacterium]
MAERTRWGGVFFGLALAVLAAFHQYKLPPVLPLLLDQYAYDPVLAGGFMSIYAVLGLLLSLTAGRLLDGHGASLVIAACGLFALGCGIALIDPTEGLVVLVARGCEGLGYTVLAIAGPACAQRSAAPAQMAFVAGLSATWVPIGQLAANGLAFPFAAGGSWRPVWWAALAITLAMALWAWRFAKAFPLGSHAAPQPKPEGRERRLLILASAVFMLWAGQYIGFMTWLNHYLVGTLGHSPGDAVAAASLAAGFVLVFNVLVGIGLRAGLPLAPLFVGSIAVEVGLWLLAPHVEGGAGLALLAVYGVACGVTPVCLFAMPPTIMGRGRVNAGGFALLMRGRNVGVLAGPLLLPLILEQLGWAVAFPVYAAVTAMAGLGAVVLVRELARSRA